jgi:hypothetical protein
MVLKLKAKPSLSNKPPPAASPDEKLFATHLDFPNGKRVWMSYPLPDRVTINGYLLAEHFQETFKNDKTPLHEKVEEFAKGLMAAYAYLIDKAPFLGKGNLLARAQLPFGPRGSKVFIDVRRVSEEGGVAFKMRMEFNPRKVGLAGCKQLQNELEQAATGAFHFGLFLADARLSRLDVAVDYADLRPVDLIVTTKKKEGQRVHYLGTDGSLETIQVHRPTKKAGVGSLAAKMYDRNRERKAHGKPPPYAGRHVTRLEIVKTRFPKGFGLADLPKMANPLADVRLSYAATLATPHDRKTWPKYLAARRGEGHDAAVRSLSLQPIIGKILRDRYLHHPSNLLGQDAWQDWAKGLHATGFGYLVASALAAKSAAS